MQVPVRHVECGQHATVALHPCNIPLQQSQATQHFSSGTNSSLAFPATKSGHTGIMLDATAADIDPHTKTGHTGITMNATAANIDQQELQIFGGTDPQTAATVKNQQTLPASLMSQALTAQAQAVPDAPCQRQQDKFVLDHRIHQTHAGCGGQQQAPATAVAQVQMQVPTAASCTTAAVAAAIAVPGRPVAAADSSQSHSLHGWTHDDSQGSHHAQHGAVSSSPVLMAPSPPNARKGMVLLDMAMHTRTVWEFEAVIVLLNGHWPPRGLLSGRWPPKPDTPDTVLSTSMLESPLGECCHHSYVTYLACVRLPVYTGPIQFQPWQICCRCLKVQIC